MTDSKPLAEGIPTDRAWQVGRRIYIKCGYESTLNKELRAINATWDPEVRALWVGSGKREKVLPLVRAHVERAARAAEVKTTGVSMFIPFEAADIRARAKDLDGVYTGQGGVWALPAGEAAAAIREAVTAWHQQQQAAKEAAYAAERAAAAELRARDAAAAAQTRTDRAAATVARSGRTVVDGQAGTASGRLYGRMRRAEAEQRKPQPGEIRRLADGRRVLVLSCTVEFWSQDAIDDGFTPDLSDEPGWFYRYEHVTVEPTADETADDEQKRAEQADETEIAAVMEAADRTPRTAWDSLTRVDGPAITRAAAGGLTIHGGKVTAAADGAVWYQHPGWYDDYRSSEAVITDPDLLARIRAILDGGPRVRGQYRVQP